MPGPDFAAEASSRYDTAALRAAWRAGAEFGYGYQRASGVGRDGIVRTGALTIDLPRRAVTHATMGRLQFSSREWGCSRCSRRPLA